MQATGLIAATIGRKNRVAKAAQLETISDG
jgi:hypothetical protein